MKDIHNHLLYGVDDGLSTIEESITLIKELVKRGYTHLILTPHYVTDTRYSVANKEKEQKLEQLKKSLLDENINIYLGNEIFITDNIKELIKSKKIKTLASTKYILIELSSYHQLSNDKEILFDLIKKGYIPILAHPERYDYYQDDIEVYKDLVDKGVLLQGNLFSLLDKHNKRKVLIKLIKENLIHFLSTDIHKIKDLELLDKSMKQLNKIIPKEKIKELLDLNMNKIIESTTQG